MTKQSTQIQMIRAVLGAVVLAVVLQACSSSNASETAPAPAAPVAPVGTPVDGRVLVAHNLDESMDVTGTINARQEVVLMSELGRKITQVKARDGKYVNKGDVLFQLDDADLRAQLEQLQQQEKLARLNEQRLRELITHQAVMQQDYDQTFTNLKVLQAQLQQLQVTMAKTTIRAPFAGTIGMVNVYPGSYVSPGTALATIEDNAQVKLDFSVPEKYTEALHEGDALHFTVQSGPKSYTARVLARESKLDPDTRSLLLRAVADNPGRELLAGQSARLKLSLNTSKGALLVPNQALIPSSQGYSVFVANGGKAELRNISVGQRDAYNVHVTSGLAAGDTLITSNMLRLAPGAAIQFISIQH